MNSTEREQHPRSHHKGATSMRTQPVGLELVTDGIQFYAFAK